MSNIGARITPFVGPVVAAPGVNAFPFIATLAEINAGLDIITKGGRHRLRLIDFLLVVNGTFTTLTDVRISTNETTPVDLATILVAQLTNGAIIVPDHAGVTLGAKFTRPLASGFGLQIRKTGSNGAGGTDISGVLKFIVEGADGTSVGLPAPASP